MRYHVMTLFPEMIEQGMNTSITGRAIEKEYISLQTIQIRDFSLNKHHKVDDYTYGGGAGMLMQAQPVYDAFLEVEKSIPKSAKRRVIYVTPQGKCFTQRMAEQFAKCDDLVFLCGHYEGIDERVLEEIVTDYVSIGDYVLTGGELPAMVMMDAVSRLVPGVLNNDVSADTESFHGDLLEYPQYSRPEVWNGKSVPAVLLQGNSKQIRKWRLEASEERTRQRRPDLYEKYCKLQECKQDLLKQKLQHIDMIEMIQRGDAKLVGRTESEILLQERTSGFYYHTCLSENPSFELVSLVERKKNTEIAFHQKQPYEHMLQEADSVSLLIARTYAYTNQEKLSITGLYRNDGKPREDGMQICLLERKDLPFVIEHYEAYTDEEYFTERITSKNMWGAFYGDTLAGFVANHSEGEMGMLYVHPDYRRRKIGAALETYLSNVLLEQGKIPYCGVMEENIASIQLQNKLGFHPAKGLVYWIGVNMEKN